MSQNRVQFTLGQIIIISCFLVTLSFFSFYLGARFGPELFWGIEVASLSQKTLLPEEALDQEVQALLAEEGDAPLTFHETLKAGNGAQKPESLEAIKEEPPQKAPVAELPPELVEKPLPDKPAAKPEPAKKPEPARKPEPAPVAKKEAPKEPEGQSDIAALIRDSQPEEPPPAQPKPEPSAPPAGAALYTLQVGSFSSIKDAIALKDKLSAGGHIASVQTVELPGKGKWHRVKAGRFGDQAAAQAEKAKIERRYGVTSVVVKL